MNQPETPKQVGSSRFRLRMLVAPFRVRPRLTLGIVGLLILLGLAASALLIDRSAQAETSDETNANIVILSYDNQERTIPTALPTVGALLNKLGIQIHQGDVVEPAPSTKIDQSKFRINIYRAQPVEIVDGSHVTYTFSAAASPRTIAAQAGVTVYPEDNLSQGPVTDSVQNDAVGEEVVINRATPVNLMLYGHEAVVRSHAKTVGDLVKEKGIVLQPGDTLTPAATTPLANGMSVMVAHQGIKYETDTETIPMPVSYISDANLSIGTSAVRQQGSPGQQEVTYQITTKNGVEVSRQAIQTVVTVEPVEEIVATGTAMVAVSGSHQDWMQSAGISPSDYGYVNYIVDHEGGSWNPCEVQGGAIDCNYSGSAGYGLVQATPGYKMASAGGDWQVNPVTQLRWATGYAELRYGSWQAAYNHWLYSHNW